MKCHQLKDWGKVMEPDGRRPRASYRASISPATATPRIYFYNIAAEGLQHVNSCATRNFHLSNIFFQFANSVMEVQPVNQLDCECKNNTVMATHTHTHIQPCSSMQNDTGSAAWRQWQCELSLLGGRGHCIHTLHHKDIMFVCYNEL